ncbi:hypothetical protein MRX96_037009 [Rhipicephalus microplus]
MHQAQAASIWHPLVNEALEGQVYIIKVKRSASSKVFSAVWCSTVCAFFFSRGVFFIFGGTAALPGAAVLCLCVCVKCYGLFRRCNQWSEVKKSLPSEVEDF